MVKIKHIVLFKFKEGTGEEVIQQLFEELLDLSESVPGIEDYVAGPNNSGEGLNQGYTHGFVMTFSDSITRDAYLAHPEHERVKGNLLPHVESLCALDFEV